MYYETLLWNAGEKKHQINADEKASEGVEKLQHKEGGGCTSLKDRLWYVL